MPAAVTLFHAALDEDSTFAMAAYYAGIGEEDTDGLAARRDLALAVHLANRVSDRERLIIRQTWAYATNDPGQLALAQSLLARFPGEPDGELALGRALAWSGNFLGALPHLERVIHMDSLSLAGRSPWCHACDALELEIAARISADSIDAAERVARDWTRMQPRGQEPRWFLVSMLARENRYDGALVVEHTAEQLSSNPAGDIITRVTIAIGAGQFAEADRLLDERAQDGNFLRRNEALWRLVISLRNQGRLKEALAAAARMVRGSTGEPPGFSTPRPLDAIAVAQVQFELRHFQLAAAQFDSISNYEWRFSPGFTSEAPGLLARHRIWLTTHVATALVAAHDTMRLASLADSVTVRGTRSASFRGPTARSLCTRTSQRGSRSVSRCGARISPRARVAHRRLQSHQSRARDGADRRGPAPRCDRRSTGAVARIARGLELLSHPHRPSRSARRRIRSRRRA